MFVTLVALLLCGLVLGCREHWLSRRMLATAKSAGGPHSETVGGVGLVFVRARIHIADAAGNPVAGARVMAAPTIEVMRTEEWVERLRESIKFQKSEGYAAWKFAMGTTDLDGVVELEYSAVTDLSDPLFGDGAQRTDEVIAFPTWLRIDSELHGTVFQELRTAKKVRYRKNPGPGEPLGFAEATFMIRGDISAKIGSESDAAAAVNIERRAGEARGAK